MNIARRFFALVATGSALVGVAAYAQTATLAADTAALAHPGGTLALTATVTYSTTPGAIG